jgi:hypothetical protein
MIISAINEFVNSTNSESVYVLLIQMSGHSELIDAVVRVFMAESTTLVIINNCKQVLKKLLTSNPPLEDIIACLVQFRKDNDSHLFIGGLNPYSTNQALDDVDELDMVDELNELIELDEIDQAIEEATLHSSEKPVYLKQEIIPTTVVPTTFAPTISVPTTTNSCKFDSTCTNSKCYFGHTVPKGKQYLLCCDKFTPEPTIKSGTTKNQCKFDLKCTNSKCYFGHTIPKGKQFKLVN